MNTTPAFRTNDDGTAVCPHRDLTVCAECATHPEVVAVAGAHFHMPDAAERAELMEALS